jgi:RND family efflux transporter MFP subunit
VLLAAALGLAGCGGKPEPSNDPGSNLPIAKVRVQKVESKPERITEEAIGTVRARLQATLEAKVSGRIAQLPVVLGQRVKAGELVARLEAAEIAARLEQANASLEQAERDWRRSSALFEQQAVTRAEYEAAEVRHRVAKGMVAEANAMMGYVVLLAPFDGVVTKKWADVGDLAAPGKALVSIEDYSALQLEADVPEAIGSHVRPGAALLVRADATTGSLTGTVAEIAPTADPLSRTFRVKLDLPPKPGWRSGQFARLLVPMAQGNSLRVPASAVVRRGQMEMVFAVVNQSAQLRLVKTGKRIGDEVEILSGLDASDSIIIEGAAQLIDGQPVEAK